jgi:hypothetical protein
MSSPDDDVNPPADDDDNNSDENDNNDDSTDDKKKKDCEEEGSIKNSCSGLILFVIFLVITIGAVGLIFIFWSSKNSGTMTAVSKLMASRDGGSSSHS